MSWLTDGLQRTRNVMAQGRIGCWSLALSLLWVGPGLRTRVTNHELALKGCRSGGEMRDQVVPTVTESLQVTVALASQKLGGLSHKSPHNQYVKRDLSTDCHVWHLFGSCKNNNNNYYEIIREI